MLPPWSTTVPRPPASPIGFEFVASILIAMAAWTWLGVLAALDIGPNLATVLVAAIGAAASLYAGRKANQAHKETMKRRVVVTRTDEDATIVSNEELAWLDTERRRRNRTTDATDDTDT